MYKIPCILLLAIAFISAEAPNASGQKPSTDLSNRIKRAEATAARLAHEIRQTRQDSERKRSKLEEKLRLFEEKLLVSEQRDKQLEQNLGAKIESAESRSDGRINMTASSVSRSYVAMAIAAVVLATISVGVFFVLSRRLGSQDQTTEEKLRETRRVLEEENVKIDQKLVELINRSFSSQTHSHVSTSEKDEPDHSLALTVADEIVRIEKNLAAMDSAVRGRKQLAASVERIRDNFAAKDYEIVAMLGRPYDDGMKLIANFRPDDSLAHGERIITRIIKPQVNYRGVMIQAAQVEVSQG